MVDLVLVDDILSVKFFNKASSIPKILESPASEKRALGQAISRSSPFEVQLSLHVFIFLEDCMRTKLVLTLCNYKSGMFLQYAF